jgi:hypothetical protein
MQKWLIASLALGLLAGQTFAACHSGGIRAIRYNCGCGFFIQRQVCTTGSSTKCNPSARQITCPGCGLVDHAGSCTSSAELQRFQPDAAVELRLLAKENLTPVVGACSVNNGQFEEWLQSHPSVVSARAHHRPAPEL